MQGVVQYEYESFFLTRKISKQSQEFVINMRANLFLEFEREEEKEKNNLEGENGTYIELFVDSPPQ